MSLIEQTRGSYLLSTDPARIDLPAVHQFLSNTYWSKGIPRVVLEKAIEGSLCFGLYRDAKQIGFARVITDGATFAYLCDVYVLEEERGQGLGQWMMETISSHPRLQGLRRFVLVTRDAHRLYARFGFKPLAKPDGFMEIFCPSVYETPG